MAEARPAAPGAADVLERVKQFLIEHDDPQLSDTIRDSLNLSGEVVQYPKMLGTVCVHNLEMKRCICKTGS
jgi:hypothetical protein